MYFPLHLASRTQEARQDPFVPESSPDSLPPSLHLGQLPTPASPSPGHLPTSMGLGVDAGKDRSWPYPKNVQSSSPRMGMIVTTPPSAEEHPLAGPLKYAMSITLTASWRGGD